MKEHKEIGLPLIIAAYWKAANAGDIPAATDCFAAQASVQDEGHSHHGTSAIGSWIKETTDKYHPVTEALRCETKEGRHHVTARVSGTFPGSPLELDFTFTLQDGKIAGLEIQ